MQHAAPVILIGNGRLVPQVCYVLGAGAAVAPGQIRKGRFDVLHAHFGVEGCFLRSSSKALGLPLVVTLHGFDAAVSTRGLVSSLNPTWIIYAALRRRTLASADALVCVSSHVAEKAVEYGADPLRIKVLTTGVTVPARIVGGERNGLVHVARLVQKKGTADLLEAIALVKRSADVEVPLRILGTGPLLESLKQRARSLGIEGQVSFDGHLPHDQTKEAISQALAVVVPSKTADNGDQEGLPTTVLEAQALGTPVVATRHAGIPDAVEDRITGLLGAEGDVRALADNILKVIRDENLRRNLAERAYKNVREKFNISVQTAILEELYDKVCGES